MVFSDLQHMSPAHQHWTEGAQTQHTPSHLYPYIPPTDSSHNCLLTDSVTATPRMPHQSSLQLSTTDELSSDSCAPTVCRLTSVASNRVETRSGSLVCYDYSGGLASSSFHKNNSSQQSASSSENRPYRGEWGFSKEKWCYDGSSTRTVLEEGIPEPKSGCK